MNLIPKPLFTLLWSGLILLALPARGAVVTANYTSAATVPVTASGYTATGNIVNFTLSFAPPVGTNLTVVNNTGLAFIQGTFDNVAQGQSVNLTFRGVTYPFVANYFSGTGNDLVLQWANTRLVAWGANNSGQLGNNSTTSSNVPVPVDMTGVLAGKTVTAMSGGSDHGLALCSDGTLAAWGSNVSHQLGYSGTNSLVPVLVDRSGVLAGRTIIAVAAGTNHNLALCSDGTLVGWGTNAWGELGLGYVSNYSTVPLAAKMSGVLAGRTVVAIAAGGSHSLALCADGTVAAWGTNAEGELGNNSTTDSSEAVAVDRSGVLAGRTVIAMAGGGAHSLALCADGAMVGWGYNAYGQLGNGSTTNSTIPVLVNRSGVLSGKSVTALGASLYDGMALCSDGTLAMWGYNGSGELGNGGTASSSVPVLVNRSGVLAGKTISNLCPDGLHSMALCSDGTLSTWGYNGNGQLGLGNTTNSVLPALVNTSVLTSGERFVAGMTAPSPLFNYAIVATPPAPLPITLAATGITDTGATLNGSVSANGSTGSISFQYGLTTGYGTTLTATPATLTGTSVAAASATPVGLLSGTTYHYRIVSSNVNGTSLGADMTFTTTNLASLSSLTLNNCALAPAFSSDTLSYGAVVPQLTDSTTVTPTSQFATATVTVNGTAVVSGTASGSIPLALGNNAVNIAVTAAGGGNTKTYTVTVTRLPDVFTFNSTTDIPVTVSDFPASGLTATFALNFAPPVGTNLTVVQNTGLNFIRGTFDNLAQGQSVNLSFRGVTYPFVANYYGGSGKDLVLQWANIRLLSWGGNQQGQLGQNHNSNVLVPTPVLATGALAGKTILSVAASAYHCLVLCADGGLVAWGYNSDGQLGDNTRVNRDIPVAVNQTGALAGKRVIAISAGSEFSLALCSDGTIAGWGANDYRQLGDGTLNYPKLVPVAGIMTAGVFAGKTITAIAAGNTHSLAQCSDGTLVAWGSGGSGQMGNGASSNTSDPVAVAKGALLTGKTMIGLGAGGDQSMVLCSDGTLAAWGSNGWGQVGNNSTANALSPVAVTTTGVLSGKTVTAIAASGGDSLALCSDSTLATWGENTNGRLGNGNTTSSLVPVAVTRTGVLAGKTIIAAGIGTALCSDGTLATWGDNTNGQLGNHSTTNSSVPVLADMSALRSGERVVAAIPSGLIASYPTGFNLAVVASPPPPTATTLAATVITDTGAILNGSVNAAGADTAVSFEYGLTTNYGTTVVAIPAAVSGTETTAVSKAISSLTAGATYHYRVVATNPNGTTVGADMTFTTPTDNPDGDNFDNLIEYAFDLSPANGVGSPFFINPSTVPTGRVELSFTRPVGATTSVTYYLEYSSALGPATSWISIPLTTINPRNITITPLNPGLETVTMRNLEAREGFVRFRVELDANGDQIIDHISYTGVEGWTESAMEPGTCTYNNPYQHEAVFTGTVDASGGVTGQTLHFTTSAGTTDLATLLAPGVAYYVEVTAGPNEGQRFDVVSATGSALTLAMVSDVCSDTPPFNTLAGVLPATLAGNRIAIHQHWTLGELFPITRFFAADIATDADQVQTSVVAATSTYWLYSNGGQPKWVKVGDATLADQANTVLAPGHGMIVTKRSIGAPLLACGEVRANNFIRPLCAGLNLVGGGYPVIQSATGTGSRQMDVAHGFFGSTGSATADMFSVWKGDATPGATGYDSYYLYNPGTSPKWVKTGDATLAPHDAELLFLGDRSVLVQVKNDVHGYTIPNQALVPLLNAATQSAASVQSLAAIGSGQDAASALIARAFGLDAPGAGALAQGKLVGGNYVIEFTEPPGVTGITYGAEYSATLLPGSWTEVPDSGTGVDHVFCVPVTGGNLFMRLKVTGQ